MPPASVRTPSRAEIFADLAHRGRRRTPLGSRVRRNAPAKSRYANRADPSGAMIARVSRCSLMKQSSRSRRYECTEPEYSPSAIAVTRDRAQLVSRGPRRRRRCGRIGETAPRQRQRVRLERARQAPVRAAGARCRAGRRRPRSACVVPGGSGTYGGLQTSSCGFSVSSSSRVEADHRSDVTNRARPEHRRIRAFRSATRAASLSMSRPSREAAPPPEQRESHQSAARRQLGDAGGPREQLPRGIGGKDTQSRVSSGEKNALNVKGWMNGSSRHASSSREARRSTARSSRECAGLPRARPTSKGSRLAQSRYG